MSYTIELNNARVDANFVNKDYKTTSPVVEVFSAMINGKDIRFDKKIADKCTNYIKELNSRASANDAVAISELNQIRRFVMEPVLMQEMKLLGIFGNYANIGYNESCEVEIPRFVNVNAKEQALGQDVGLATIRKERVPVATTTISAGYAVDYRKAALGDMSDENDLQEQIRVQMRNKAARYVVETIYNAVKETKGVKFLFEGAGLTKTGVDGVLSNVRRFGKPTVSGDYALISQFNGFAGYQGVTPTVNGISESVMNEIHNTGLMGMYNGAVLSEIPNPFDLTTVVGSEGQKTFATILPAGLGFVTPAGSTSPIYTVTRGGITTMSGSDVTSGNLISRFDLEIGSIVAKGREYEIGMLLDKNLSADLAA